MTVHLINAINNSLCFHRMIFFPVPVVRDREQTAFLVEMVCFGNLKCSKPVFG